MTRKFIWVISSLLAILLANIGFLIASHPADRDEPSSYDSHPILQIVGYVTSNHDREFPLQLYVTPENEVIKKLAAEISGPEDAYKMAVEWIYVTEQDLNQVAEKWLKPAEFLADTPHYPNNPLVGRAVSDCEEQANTLVSLFRAVGIPAEEVRVVLGKVSDDETRGHAWVELLTDGDWLALDPSDGPYWDDKAGRLVRKEGVPFNYYASHAYPVPLVSAYYNDIYFLNPGDGSGNAPASWYEIPE